MRSLFKNLLIAVVVNSILLVGFSTIFVPHVMDIAIHEIGALTIVAVVSIHVYLMRSFFKFVAAQRAPYFVYRNFTLLGILVALVASVASGVCISYCLFQGMIPVDRHAAHIVHNASTTYMLMFIGVHLGCYMGKFFSWLDNNLMPINISNKFMMKLPSFMVKLGLLVVSYHGAIQIFKPSYLDKITLNESFSIVDYDSEISELVINNLAILVFYIMVSAAISYALLMLSTKKEHKRKQMSSFA